MQLVDISVLSPKKVLFNGKGRVLTFPGEQGVFEVMAFHKKMLTRLVSGVIFVDNMQIPIKRGILKVDKNKAIAVVEDV